MTETTEQEILKGLGQGVNNLYLIKFKTRLRLYLMSFVTEYLVYS